MPEQVPAPPNLEGVFNTVPQNATVSAYVPVRPVQAPPGYKILGEIGRGGMGVVYRARDVAIDREVALKFLQDKFAADSPAAKRFIEEARITGQLQHPGIPAVHQVGTLPDGRPYLAMKLIKGRTLDELLENRDKAGPHNWLAVFEALCQAVGYAHAHRVIHRDLKPQNVMVGSFGEVQVMDWGLAKVLADDPNPQRERGNEATVATEIRSQRDSDGTFTHYGSVMGTPSYMSPEQAGGETDRIERHSDVFCLGAILCVILTGQPPYTGKDSETVRRAAMRGQLDDAIARLDACGAEPLLIALAKRCMTFEPAERYPDANDVAAEVSRLRADAEQRARDAELQRARAEVRAAEQRKRRKIQFTLVVVCVIGALTSAYYAANMRRARDQAEQARFQLQAAEARNNEVVSRLFGFISKHPEVLKLDKESMLARFASYNPDISPTEIGSATAGISAPNMFGD